MKCGTPSRCATFCRFVTNVSSELGNVQQHLIWGNGNADAAGSPEFVFLEETVRIAYRT